MEEKQAIIAHKLNLSDRNSGNITGAIDVLSFDMNEIILATQQGLLTIKGKELHVTRLNLEKQEVDLEGTIDSLIYSEGGAYSRKTGETLLKRLFK